MTEDLRDVLEVLRFELNHLEQGGFNWDRAMLGKESPFKGTFACANFGDALQAHACHECLLYQFVPDDKKNEEFPCHYIQLNDSGETVAQLIEKKDPARLVKALERWLRETIERLETTLVRGARSSEPDIL